MLLTIGLLIFVSVIFTDIFTGFNLFQLFFTVLFLALGLNFLRKRSTEYLGSLIFGIILLLDLFNFFPTNLNFWQLFLLLIASYLIALGLDMFFVKKKSHQKFKNEIIEFELPRSSSNEEIEIITQADWSNLTVDSSNINSSLKMKVIVDKNIFSFKKQSDLHSLKISNKLKVSNVKVPQRAKITFYLNEEVNFSYKANLNVSDAFLDFREIKIKEVNLKATASKITLIPSEKENSNVEINSEISSINITLPKKVGLVLNHIGDINFKNFENMIKRDDGTYVSNNFSEAISTCYINVLSDMSRLNIEVI